MADACFGHLCRVLISSIKAGCVLAWIALAPLDLRFFLDVHRSEVVRQGTQVTKWGKKRKGSWPKSSGSVNVLVL